MTVVRAYSILTSGVQDPTVSLEGLPLSFTFWKTVSKTNSPTQVSSLRFLSSFRQAVIWPIHAKAPSMVFPALVSASL